MNRRARGDDTQLSLGHPPTPLKLTPVEHCLRKRVPRAWTHKGQFHDNLTVAVFCGCLECEQMLLSTFRRSV